MGKYSLIQRKLSKLSIGEMRDRIKLHTRAIQPIDYNSYDFTETYDAGTEMWSQVSEFSLSNSNRHIFDGVNLATDSPTHTFGVRYRSWITQENMIRWRSETYDIIKVQDFEERHQFLLLHAKLRGLTSKKANL